ncbi:hypothetical protein GLAREA_09624 [Glarea lozoyensis ATCC 20868]|uniref:Uncharacterized protein n=1 Tax=Glarea lozoyensis (strain ATCC 20868 / MF5171) TaxID=1116229 RepID=S3DPV3_GLAL2|nr:uncharacterized protein GLAREA_09624 [Glarea lozoyensis ATCC 20868]EPE28503.1 hypothetical protein GLAREA_09624 [Glarea lozoyensis ATCC 20868]
MPASNHYQRIERPDDLRKATQSNGKITNIQQVCKDSALPATSTDIMSVGQQTKQYQHP